MKLLVAYTSLHAILPAQVPAHGDPVCKPGGVGGVGPAAVRRCPLLLDASQRRQAGTRLSSGILKHIYWTLHMFRFSGIACSARVSRTHHIAGKQVSGVGGALLQPCSVCAEAAPATLANSMRHEPKHLYVVVRAFTTVHAFPFNGAAKLLNAAGKQHVSCPFTHGLLGEYLGKNCVPQEAILITSISQELWKNALKPRILEQNLNDVPCRRQSCWAC